MIKINYDSQCPECGAVGTSPCGVCVECAEKFIAGKEATTVHGKIVASTIKRRIEHMFRSK